MNIGCFIVQAALSWLVYIFKVTYEYLSNNIGRDRLGPALAFNTSGGLYSQFINHLLDQFISLIVVDSVYTEGGCGKGGVPFPVVPF